MKKIAHLLTAALLLCSSLALADGRDLTNKSIFELGTVTTEPASGDYLLIYDASADGVRRVAADDVPFATVDINTLEIDSVAVTATAAQINLTSANPGRDWFNICGEATTVNNNTVYYGPSIVLLASSGNGQTCDINAAGSTTEATADAPIYTNQAVNVLGMTCRNEADANADISYTLRTAAGATVAVAAASTGDIADGNGFNCKVEVSY